MALKFCTSRREDPEAARDELRIMQHLIKADPAHWGSASVLTILDSFEVEGSDRTHLCLVLEPMRENLSFFQKRWLDGKLPLSLVKRYLRCLLEGLDYLHSCGDVLHGGKRLIPLIQPNSTD